MVKRNFLTKMLLLCALIVGSVSSAWAETVTFVAGTDTSNGTSITKNGITVSFSDGVFNRTDNYRCYSSASMTISSTVGNMTQIDFEATSSNPMTKFTGDPDVGAWTDSSTKTQWTGNASVINFGTTSGQCRITTITVTYTPASSYSVTYNGNGNTSGDVPTDNKEYNSTNNIVTVLGNTGNLAKTNYLFNGWNTSANGEGTAYTPGATFTITSNTTLYAQWKLDVDGDLLDRAFTEVNDGATTYSDWSGKTGESGAVYAGNSAGSNNAIQLRSTNNSGIVTTTSGGKVKKVTVVWNSNTISGRTIDIYGKNTAYSAASDLYNSTNQGTKLGSIVCGTSTSLTIEGDYEYIGIRSNSGALYLDQIVIKWEAEDPNKIATTTTIDATGITYTDVYVNTAAGTLSATVTETDGGAAVSGATVTWSSSDEDVAKIDANGVVTLVAAGTTTITASYAGDDTYLSSFAEYELTVTSSAPYVQPTEVTAIFNNVFLGTDVGGRITETTTITQDRVKFVFDKISGSNWPQGDANIIRMYQGTTLQIIAPSGYLITNITFTANGDWKNGMTADKGNYDDALDNNSKTYWTGEAEDVTFSPGGSHRIATVVVTLAESVSSVSLAPAKTYTTLTSAYNLDFRGLSLKAFIVLDNDASDGKVTMTQVNKVPAETGLVIKSENPGEAVEVPVFDGTGADNVEGNKMLGSSAATTYIAENEGYILKDGAFHPSSGNGVLAAGKAYLAIAVNDNAPALSMDFGEGTTGIQNIECTMNDNQYYTLDGRRVAQPTKGLYIVNGKKVLVP